MKQIIGTVCDNFKVPMFLEEFEKAGIKVISHVPLMPGMTLIKCHAEQADVKPVVDKVTQHFIDVYKQQKYN